MRRSIHALAAVAALTLALAGCASGKDTGLPAGPTSPPKGETCSGTVDMVNLTFEPEECTVPVGTTVTWVNRVGGLPHTVVSEEDKFNSGAAPIQANGEFSFTFREAGSYPYFCSLHATKGARAGMIGTIIVQPGAGTGSPSPTST